MANDHDEIEGRVVNAIHTVLGERFVRKYEASKNKLRPGKNRATSGDFELPYAIEVFKAHITSLHTQGATSFDEPLRLTTISSYGLERERVYTSSYAIGQALAARLLEDDLLRPLVADVRCNQRGLLVFTSHRHLEWHALHGRLPCSLCGLFFNGPRGIRWHQMKQHDANFGTAQEEALMTEWQLIVYTPSASFASCQAPAPSSSPAAMLPTLAKIQDKGIRAAAQGDLKALQELQATSEWHPANEDHNGCNALVWAAGGGHLNVCNYLVLECNMDPAALQGKRGTVKLTTTFTVSSPGMRRNALHWAARNGHLEICQWLVLELGIPVDMPTADGTTAFHYAVWNDQLSMCEWLVSVARCNVHHLNSYGCNATQWSCMTGSVSMMEFLCAQGVNFTLLNHNGHSALHKAAIKGHQAACEWLLAHGGLGHQHMQEDDDGFTPVRFAVENGHAALGKWLQEQYTALVERQEKPPPILVVE
ncbi:unnamed protein product [Aphanomyces euteiches]